MPSTTRLLDRARTVSDEIARRLADDERLRAAIVAAARQTRHPDVNVWRPHSLAFGDCGLALTFGGLGPDWSRTGHRLLARAAETSGTCGSLSLFEGLSGLSCAAEALSRDGTRYRGLRERLDRSLSAGITASAEPTARAAVHDGAPNDAFDLISGITGWGAALLTRDTSAGLPALAAVLRGIVHLLGDEDGQPRLTTAPRHMLAPAGEAYPRGAVDLGVAHGLPGLLALASLALRLPSPAVPGLADAVRWGADWLSRVQDQVADPVSWPHFVALDEHRGLGRFGPAGGAKWCYGAAGASRALWLAGTALGDHAIRERAVAIGRHLVRADPDEIESPGICHGLSGLLMVIQRFASDTGNDEFESSRSRLLRALLDRYDDGYPLGYQDIEYGGNPVDNPGLLSGAAGVALTIAGQSGTEPPWWHRLFLVA